MPYVNIYAKRVACSFLQIFKNFILFIYSFLAALDLHYHDGGLPFIVVASLVAEHRLWARRGQ